MSDAPAVHVWQKHEITLHAEREYENAYTDATVWVDLEGPGFSRRCYGFWDGANTFRVRMVATAPGRWTWRSGSDPDDSGLSGREGAFDAVEWTEDEKLANPCRRGFLRPTPNGHALQYADGTPCFVLGDTWWPLGSYRYRWYDDDTERPLGPDMGLKDIVRYRKAQGYNCVAAIAAFPHWANDDHPPNIVADDDLTIRDAWQQDGTPSAKDMHDEDGNRPFEFPGRVPGFEDVVPDLDRPNPAYFRSFDRKIDYLNSQGFMPFVEVARRDIGQVWQRHYDWPDSYARYIQYVWTRLQASNCLLSPIHFDWAGHSIPAEEWNVPCNLVIERWGPPPFGQPVGPNSSGTSLQNFGHTDRAKWLTFHQLGNWRQHENYHLLTEAFETEPTVPCMNGEPYYDGWPMPGPEGGSEEAAHCSRSGIYGSVLSGGLAGHIHGASGLWPGNVEDAAVHRIWDALPWPGAAQMQHAVTFLTGDGRRYWDLLPDVGCVSPNRAGEPHGYEGWAYCARTSERDLLLFYFEKGCPRAELSGLVPGGQYRFRWFDPRHGRWVLTGPGLLVAADDGRSAAPDFPDASDPAANDWSLELVL